MISIDTNVVVRLFLTADDEQHRRATELVGANEVFVALTVLLEAAWVLQETYQQPKAAVIGAFRRLADLPNVAFEDDERARRALAWAEAGMDFADALHLGASEHSFASFDKKLAKVADRLGAPQVRAP